MTRFLKHKFRMLVWDESGQSLVFGVLSVFIVLFFGAMVLGVGGVTARRVQLQHAADAAAYGAAAVESECLNLIAATNTAIARIRGKSMHYIADLYMYGVLNEIRGRIVESRGEIQELEEEMAQLLERLEEDPDDAERRDVEERIAGIEARLALLEELYAGWTPDEEPDPWWVVEKIGIDRADLEFERASERAETWVNAAGGWVRDLSRLQRTVAILAPQIASETAYRTAGLQGARAVSVFPASRWYPRPDNYLQVRAGRDELPQDRERWFISGGGEEIEVIQVSCSEAAGLAAKPSFCAECRRAWVIQWQRGVESARYLVVELEDRRWYWQDMDTGRNACIQQTEEFRVVTWGPENVDVVYHDGYRAIINTDGQWPANTMFVRRAAGSLEIARPPHDAPEDWLPEDEDFSLLPPTQVNIDGVNISITMDPVIPLPGYAEIRVLDPWYIELSNAAGEVWARVHLREGRTYLTATINRVHVRVQDGRARFRRRGEELWTHRENGQWHAHFDLDYRYWWQHRLTPNDERNRWLYEYEEEGGRLRQEQNLLRLTSHHATAGADGWADGSGLPGWLHENERMPAGWMELRGGAWGGLLTDAGAEDGYDYNGYSVSLEGKKRFHQIRNCWEPGCDRGRLPPAGDEEDAEPAACPTCEGQGFVLVDAGSILENLPDVSLEFLDREDFMPLVLDEEFVKHGITVGVWSPRESHFRADRPDGQPDRPVEYLLHDPQAGMRGIFRGEGGGPRRRGERLRPAWGHFAVAAARPLLFSGATPAEHGAMEHGWHFSESAVGTGARARWLDESMWNLYLVNSGGEWSHWDAALVPINMQLLDVDIRDLVGAETGAGWLMQRIAYGSPGGVMRTRHADTPPWWRYDWSRYFGHASGWAQDIYGGYDMEYPPGHVRERLLDRVRARHPYPERGPAYVDPRTGTVRDPLTEYLADREEEERGPQIEWWRMRPEHIVH